MKTNLKKWIKAAGIRSIKTIAQTAVGLIGTSLVFADVNWQVVLSCLLYTSPSPRD